MHPTAFLHRAVAVWLNVALLALVSSAQAQYAEYKETNGSASCSEPQTYKVKFENLWISDSHPVNYPSGAHVSPGNLASHSDAYSMWR